MTTTINQAELEKIISEVVENSYTAGFIDGYEEGRQAKDQEIVRAVAERILSNDAR